MKEYMKEVYKLKNLVRYNNTSRLKDESVAEHCFFVALLTKHLCEIENISEDIKLMAMSCALTHDLPEIYLSDIPHSSKNILPGFNDMITKVENKIVDTYLQDDKKDIGIFDYQFEMDRNKKVAGLLVNLADVLSVIQYCVNEEELGNKTFKSVRISTCSRVEKILSILEGFNICYRGMGFGVDFE